MGLYKVPLMLMDRKHMSHGCIHIVGEACHTYCMRIADQVTRIVATHNAGAAHLLPASAALDAACDVPCSCRCLGSEPATSAAVAQHIDVSDAVSGVAAAARPSSMLSSTQRAAVAAGAAAPATTAIAAGCS